MKSIVDAFMDQVKERNSHEPEFLQAVEEITEDGNVTFVENLSQIRGDYDVAIVAYGEPPYAEYAGDRRDLNFAGTKHLTHLKLLIFDL